MIIQTASIGDVILATPIVETLHRAYPDAEIDVLTKKGPDMLLSGHPFLRRVLVWDKSHKKYQRLFELLSTIRSGNYELVINVQRFLSTGVLTAFSAAKIKCGFKKNPLSLFFTHAIDHNIGDERIAKYPHETERNLSLLKWMDVDSFPFPRLYPSPADFKSVSAYKEKKYICIAPASLWFTKQFPVNKWLAFVNSLHGDLGVFLLGSKDDEKLCATIKEGCLNNDVVSLAGRLSLLQTAALMKDAMMNFVNDSAPMHIASAMNANVTAVFCSTIPAFGFGPLSDNSFVVEVEEDIKCRPCGLHGRQSCPEGHFNCANKITNEQLMQGLGL